MSCLSGKTSFHGGNATDNKKIIKLNNEEYEEKNPLINEQ